MSLQAYGTAAVLLGLGKKGKRFLAALWFGTRPYGHHREWAFLCCFLVMPVASWRTQAILLLYWSQLGLRFWLVSCHFLLRFRVAQCDGDAGCSGMLNGTISVRWIFDLLEFFFVHYIIIVNVCYRIWSWYVFWVCSPVDKAYSGADVWPRSQCEVDRMRSWSLHVGILGCV